MYKISTTCNVCLMRKKLLKDCHLKVLLCSSQVSYDHLILCTGLQFMVPAEIMMAVDDGVDTTNSLSNSPLTDLSHKLPTNLFIINDSYDAAVTLYKAEKVMLQKQSTVAYNCLLIFAIQVAFK